MLCFMCLCKCTAVKEVPYVLRNLDLSNELDRRETEQIKAALACPGWGRQSLWMNGSKDPRVPVRASVPIAVHT